MAIAARCPKCQSLFQVSDSLDGKLVRCKKCQETFVVGIDVRPEGPLPREEPRSGIRPRRDDRYEDDNAEPPPAPPIPRKWLLLGGLIGGAAFLFIGLLMTAISSLETVEKKQVAAPPPAPQPHVDLSPSLGSSQPASIATPTYGAHETVVVQVAEVADDTVRRFIEQKLEALVDSRPASLHTDVAGQSLTITLAPVRDPAAFAKKIDFGPTVLGVDVAGGVVKLSARGTYAVLNPPAPGSIRPQVSAPFELPPDSDDRLAQLPPPTLWQVKVDPPSEPGARGLLAAIKVTKAPLVVPGFQRAICPSTPSGYVAVGGGIGVGAAVQLFNLQTLKAGKRMTIPTGLVDPLALSPDGTLIAGRGGPAAGPQNSVIEVWSFNTGKRVQTLPMPEGARAKIELIDFARPGQLVVMKSDLGRRMIQLWDIDKGEILQEWLGPLTYQPNTAALSPGRTYLAAGDRDKLWIYDLQAGQPAAEADLAGPGKTAAQYECYGLAFAPDGTELAGVFETPARSRLICWDVARGEVLADHVFDKRLQWNYKGPPVEWLPDRSAVLLYGKHLIELVTGRQVYEVPGLEQASDRQIHVLGSDRVLDAVQTFQGVALQVVPLPAEQLTSAIEATRKAWNALKLPPAKPGNWSEARAAAPASVKWSVRPDGVPTRSERFTTRPIVLAPREPDIQRLLFSNAATAVAGVLYDVLPTQLVTKKVLRLERYDLTRGQSLGGLNLCIDPQYRFGEALPCDLSGDATRVVLRGCQDPRRVDVWSLSEGKHIAGWFPFAETLNGTMRAEPVTWVAFHSTKHLFTLNSAGKLVLWSIADLKALYVLENVLKDSVALSATEQYVAVAQHGAYRLYEAATGVPVGVLGWPALAGASTAPTSASGAFSADGTQFAAAAAGTLTYWDLKTGKESGSFPLGMDVTELHWADARHLLARGTPGQPLLYLIDLERQAALCSYRLPGAGIGHAGPDGRLWYLQASANQCTLARRSVPDATVASIDMAVRNPSTPALLKPGMTVAVRVDVPGNDTIRLEILATLQRRLQAAGFLVGDAAPVTLSFRAALNSGDEISHSRHTIHHGAGAPGAVAPGKKLVSSVALGDGRGNVWWRQESSSAKAGAVPEDPRRDAEPQAREQRLWQNAVTFAAQLPLPTQVYLVNGQPVALPVPVNLELEGR